MNKLSVERRKELGERLYEIAQEIAAIRKEVGVNSLIIGAWRGSVNAYGFFGTTEEGAGGIQIDCMDEGIKDIFICDPCRVLDECSIETLEKAHECFGWDFPNGEAAG